MPRQANAHECSLKLKSKKVEWPDEAIDDRFQVELAHVSEVGGQRLSLTRRVPDDLHDLDRVGAVVRELRDHVHPEAVEALALLRVGELAHAHRDEVLAERDAQLLRVAVVDQHAVREQAVVPFRLLLGEEVEEAQIDQRLSDRDVADARAGLGLANVDVVDAIRVLQHVVAMDAGGLADPHARVQGEQRAPIQVVLVHLRLVGGWLENLRQIGGRERLVGLGLRDAFVFGQDVGAGDWAGAVDRLVGAVAHRVFEQVGQGEELVVHGLGLLARGQQRDLEIDSVLLCQRRDGRLRGDEQPFELLLRQLAERPALGLGPILRRVLLALLERGELRLVEGGHVHDRGEMLDEVAVVAFLRVDRPRLVLLPALGDPRPGDGGQGPRRDFRDCGHCRRRRFGRLVGAHPRQILGERIAGLGRPAAGDHADPVDGLHGGVMVRLRAVGLDLAGAKVDLIFAQRGQVEAKLRQRRILPSHALLPCAGRRHGRVDL